MRSPSLREQIESKAKSTSGVNNINSKEIQALSIALPNLPTQTQIVAEIEARLSEADAMETTIRNELKRAENLRQSILKQAFSGKLVTGENITTEVPETPILMNSPVEQQTGQLNLF